MLCRLLLGAIFILYLICVLILSGIQREDLEVGLLKKLEHYNINIDNAINNVTVLKECLTSNSSDDEITTSRPTVGTIIFSTNKPKFLNIVKKKVPKKHNIIEIDLDSDPIDSENIQEDNSKNAPTHNKLRHKTVQDILNLWESYVTQSSNDNEDSRNKDILEFDKRTITESINSSNITETPQSARSPSSIKIPENDVNSETKYDKKDVQDYIMKQFEKYFNNKTKASTVLTKRKKIQVKMNKTENQANIFIDSKGVKQLSFLNIPEATDRVTIRPSSTVMSPIGDQLMLSDYIINKIAKSVKSMVIDDLRKEFQPLNYQRFTNTTIKCCPIDEKELQKSINIMESTTQTPSATTSLITTTTAFSKLSTEAQNSIPENLMTLFNQPLKKEYILALGKFLESFSIQNQDKPVLKPPSVQTSGVYPHNIQSFQMPKYSADSNQPKNNNNIPQLYHKTNQNTAQSNLNIPQYSTNFNQMVEQGKPRPVYTLQSDIADIPPLRVMNHGVHVFQNIIVTTRSPEGGQNKKQRWWKPKRNLYPPLNYQLPRSTFAPVPQYAPDVMDNENIPTLSPIRMSKGKFWDAMYKHSPNGYAQRPPYKPNPKNMFKGTKFHELLEFSPDYPNIARPDESQDKFSSQGIRYQQPLNHKKTYNEAPYKKIMQTQQKVNEMLEKILEMNKYPTDNISAH